MDSLKKRRSVIKGQMTKIVSFAESIEASTRMEDIKARLDKVSDLWTEFVKIEDKMFDISPETVSLSEEFDESYYHAVALLNAALRHFHTAAQVSITGPHGENTCQYHSNATETRLPRLNIPIFNGELQDWQSFFDLFNSCVHEKLSLSAAQKLQYLKGLLKGEPLGLIKHLGVTDANYVEAYQILIKRYDKKKFTINSYIDTFFKQPHITRINSTTIRRLADTTEEIVRGLKAVGQPGDSRDPWLIYIIVNKLDDESRQFWQNTSSKIEHPTLQNLIECLQTRADTLEGIKETATKPAARLQRSVRDIHTASNVICPLCNVEHMLYLCPKFKDMKVVERRTFIKESSRCFNCLSDNHTVRTCKSKRSCQICRNRHNSLLHTSNVPESQVSSQLSTIAANTNLASPNTFNVQLELTNEPTSTVDQSNLLQSTSNATPTTSINIYQPERAAQCTTTSNKAVLRNHLPNITTNCQSLLPTAIILVTDVSGKTQSCRALLDSGSQATFITEECVKRLALPRRKAHITIRGVGSSTAGTTRGETTIEITSRVEPKFKLTINALILPKVTAPIPSSNLSQELWSHLSSLPLADPTFHQTSNIDILIGAEYFFDILTEGKLTHNRGNPIAHNTVFGWVIAGKIDTGDVNCLAQINSPTEVEITQVMQKFWEAEEVPARLHLSPEERSCGDHFMQTYQRTPTGRFMVNLPFKQSRKPLGNSRDRAIRRLFALENRMNRYPDMKAEYVEFIRQYIQLGHMERICPTLPITNPNNSYYMPHHAVVKESSSTTKLRVVFDASAKTTSNISLNDNLMIGPTVQDSLFNILVRFRRHAIVFTSDIEKMYRQILINPDDADFQRIVWRESSDLPVEDYRLLTVTYGTASAPYLATKTLTVLADFHSTQFPVASQVIKQDVYIDDLMTGANSENEALLLQCQIIKILESSGFHLRKWTSNRAALLESIPPANQELSPVEITEGTRSVKLLGLAWCPTDDTFKFKVVLNSKATRTKREMLSEAAKIFDPLGWLSPITINIKVLFQSLWLLNLQWDDPLPVTVAKKWNELRSDLITINQVSIPRWLGTDSETYQLHGFSDSSESAYAAVVFCRSENKGGKVQTHLVCAKTRVAPIKHVSIPRLELCGALLLTRLMKVVIEALQPQALQSFYWTDSTNVLWWLSSHPKRWKSYVANRTAEILESTSRISWGYVPTEENPADCSSRGISPLILKNYNLWWTGPEWLKLNQEYWPNQKNLDQTVPHTNEDKPTKPQKLDVIVVNELLDELSTKYSTFSKFVRIIAITYRFYNNLKRSVRNENPRIILSPSDYRHSTNILVKWAQTNSFSTELSCLQNDSALPKGNKLMSLNPFIDDQGVLRVGSRIQHANIEYQKKFPIILPASHNITNLIIAEVHTKYFHAAQSLMVSILRQRYWIINCKNLVRQTIHRCVTCTRYKPQRINQLMGDLPPARVNFKYAFNKTGVDYAGPITLRAMVGRRPKLHKAYISIFVCMSTKAVHIELVSDLSTSAFIAALKRFMSRRGVCTDLYSDNGTNFVGARNQLAEIYKLNKTKTHNHMISNFLLDFETKWHFAPPSAPNFGGLYEAAVKSTKFHLRRVLGNTILNFEEMTTLLTQIEAVLNSRPLCSLTSGPDDINMLTPAHFLTGHQLTLPPDPDYTDVKPTTLTRWHHVQYMMKHFWNRFYNEYLTTLHNRSKWQHKHNNLKVDDIVLLRDDNTAPAQWPLGRIHQTHPGLDGLVRVVSVKTKSGIYKRPIRKIIRLPVF